MFKYILEKAGDIDWMALVPLVLFVVIFTFIILRTMRQKKDYVDHMSNLPLEDDEALNVEK